MFPGSMTHSMKNPKELSIPRRRAHHPHQYLSTTCDNHGKPMYTTRHLAALDFLLNIPMKNEHMIHEIGLANVSRLQSLESGEEHQENAHGLHSMEDSSKGGHSLVGGLPVNDSFELPERDWRGFSYKQLFKSLHEEKQSEEYFEKGYLYDPNSLDSSDQTYRNALVNAIEAKASPRPTISPTLTLTDIKNIKKPTLFACLALSIEISTVALAVISFERLTMKNIVNKTNLKLAMAVSLLLAYKFNEPFSPTFKARLEGLLDFIDRTWQISRRQVLDAEFGGYVSLGFTLHVPQAHLHLVYNRLLRSISKTSKEYLGKEMYEAYTHDRLMCEAMRMQDKAKHLKSDDMRLSMESGIVDEDAMASLARATSIVEHESSSSSSSSTSSSPSSREESSSSSSSEEEGYDLDPDEELHLASSPMSLNLSQELK
jgi:hypothetical protein